MPRGLCFDLDGTLINSSPGGLARITKVAKILNLPMDDQVEARLREMWGQHPKTIITTIWPDADAVQFSKIWQDLDIAEPFPVFPGVKKALKELFKEFYLSILTNRSFRATIAQLEHNDLLQFFGLVVAGDSGPYKKPDPRSIDPIFHKYYGVGISPKQLIFVGDTVEGDWKLAQATGIEFYAIGCGGIDTREKFLFAGVPEDHVINSVADLPEILLK